jgi:DNA repair protein RecN (Recombination protein N)
MTIGKLEVSLNLLPAYILLIIVGWLAGYFVVPMNALLQQVDMPNARIKVEQATVEPGVLGIDEISLLLDANKSAQYQPIEKTASGGELSRIMLCIKSICAEAMDIPTLVFDEVDAGISGEAARQVALLLQALAGKRQIISITHQPQVAAKGTRHFYIYKEQEGAGRLNTRSRVLNGDERVLAIARMIGGAQPTSTAMDHARELLNP